MLEARSVAVVGASVKEGSLGQQMLLELERGGFAGDIYPVNPGYDEVLGHRSFASLADVLSHVKYNFAAQLSTADKTANTASMFLALTGKLSSINAYIALFDKVKSADV